MAHLIIRHSFFQHHASGLAPFGVRFFSGRRLRKVTRTSLTSQENLLLQQKLRELQMQQQPRKPGFMNIIKDGLLHGIGWSFAQRMVDSIFGPRTLNIKDFTGNGTDIGAGSPDMTNGMCILSAYDYA